VGGALHHRRCHRERDLGRGADRPDGDEHKAREDARESVVHSRRPTGPARHARHPARIRWLHTHRNGRGGTMQELMDPVFGPYPSWSHLIVRLTLGVIFFAHGAQKVFGWFGGRGLSATIAGFRQMNIPPSATVLAAFVECFGGLAVLVGFLTRPAALGLIAVMLVAIAKVHVAHGFFLNWS